MNAANLISKGSRFGFCVGHYLVAAWHGQARRPVGTSLCRSAGLRFVGGLTNRLAVELTSAMSSSLFSTHDWQLCGAVVR